MQWGFGAAPCVSRRPMIETTGPHKPTVPTFHSTSRSTQGVYHEPTNMLPQGPCSPTAALRDASVAAMLFDCSISAFCEISNQAVSPPPRDSRPRMPHSEPPWITSHFETPGTPLVLCEYFTRPKAVVILPVTSTLPWASAMHGAANAPATATARSFLRISPPGGPLAA